MGAPLTIARRTLTIDDFHKLADAGVFRDDERIELIEGELIAMAPIGHVHAYWVSELTRSLERMVGEEAIVWVQNPIVRPPNNQLQPDIALLWPPLIKYKTRLPSVEDVLLVVEIADTTIAYDRDVKTKIYAAGGVPEVWLLSTREETLFVFRSPVGDDYAHVQTLRKSDSIALVKFPKITVRVSDLLP
jgi:Uma2 family endonuclease